LNKILAVCHIFVFRMSTNGWFTWIIWKMNNEDGHCMNFLRIYSMLKIVLFVVSYFHLKLK
jgi:hypothetical protein